MKFKSKFSLNDFIYILLFMNVSLLFPVKGQVPNKYAVKGTKEFGGSIYYQHVTPIFNGRSGEPVSIFSFAPFFGLFLFDGFEIGISPLEMTIVSQSENKTTQFMICTAPAYHYKINDKVYPFIEMIIGYSLKSFKDDSNDGLSWGARCGVKISLTDSGMLNLSLRYLQATMNPDKASDRNGFNQILLSVGWTVWFSKALLSSEW